MPRPRLAFSHWPAAIYAIGDVHGCIDQLRQLEDAIAADADQFEGEKWLVTLGDYVDRGPDSRAVVAHVMGPPPKGMKRFALGGNHEQILLDFAENPAAHAFWLEEGGVQTLASYGIALDYPPLRSQQAVRDLLRDRLPADHLAFMAGLPSILTLPGWVFVHAGIRPGIAMAHQTDEDLMWIRAPFLTSQLTAGVRVVHGHTPSPDIVVTPHRIGIDTHCFHTGKLSAVRVTPDGHPHYLEVRGESSGWVRKR